MRYTKQGYFLIETIIACALGTIIIKALFGLASHVVILSTKIDEWFIQSEKTSLSLQKPILFTFVQTQVPHDKEGFTAVIEWSRSETKESL